MSWVNIEEATQAAIVAASGLPPSSVLWSYQNQGELPMPYVRINFGGERAIGIDRIASSYSAARPNGQEFKQEVKGVREVPLDIEVFTSQTLGESSARRLCEVIRTKLRFDSIRTPLRRAGLSPFDPGPVQYIPDIPKVVFRGRAICTVRCYVSTMDCIEYVGYIARVRGLIVPLPWTGPSGSSGIAFDSVIST